MLIAVRYMHLRDVVHRDLKPGNIFLHKIAAKRDDPVPCTTILKIGDLGLVAKVPPNDAGVATLVGTLFRSFFTLFVIVSRSSQGIYGP
jgi:serine/threonine protein kinase